MRLSTPQMFQQGLNALLDQQSKLNDQQLRLGAGKRILSPSDDPAGAVKALTFAQKVAETDQYQRNIGEVNYQLALQEDAIASVMDSIQTVRELTLQGNASGLSEVAKKAIATEIGQRLEGMIAVANTRDAAGEYIFGGYQVDAPPFMLANGVPVYRGDDGQRFLRIGDGAQIAIRESGAELFQNIKTGNGVIEVLSDPANQGTLLVGAIGQSGATVADAYTVTFTQATAADPITYTVTGSAGVSAPVTYKAGDSLSFAGMDIALSGVPANGDVLSVSPAGHQDLFATVQAIVDALQAPTPDASAKTQLHNAMGAALDNLDQVMSHLDQVRANIGARMNNVEAQSDMNESFRVQLQTVLADTVGLDYAEAVTRFTQQQIALQVAQQSFVKVQNLSLFQYL